MAKIKAQRGGIGGNESPITARDKVNGDDSSMVGIKADFLVMPTTACGIRNQGGTEVTALIVMVNSDETNTSAIKVPANSETVTTGLFNAVKITGSTGHDAATTEYLLA